MFTTGNTEGYTAAESAALNAELAARLVKIDANDVEAITAAEQEFADEVARR